MGTVIILVVLLSMSGGYKEGGHQVSSQLALRYSLGWNELCTENTHPHHTRWHHVVSEVVPAGSDISIRYLSIRHPGRGPSWAPGKAVVVQLSRFAAYLRAIDLCTVQVCEVDTPNTGILWNVF